MPHPIVPLLLEARHVLAWSQGDLANLFGVSRRTIQRWDAQGGYPDAKQVSDLARAVYPRDPQVAARFAQAAGTSLEQLGLVVAPPARAELTPFVLDSITCAAADAMNMVPATVRAGLRAAFERARDLGLGRGCRQRAVAGQAGSDTFERQEPKEIVRRNVDRRYNARR